jgi:hypothetical protein
MPQSKERKAEYQRERRKSLKSPDVPNEVPTPDLKSLGEVPLTSPEVPCPWCKGTGVDNRTVEDYRRMGQLMQRELGDRGPLDIAPIVIDGNPFIEPLVASGKVLTGRELMQKRREDRPRAFSKEQQVGRREK